MVAVDDLHALRAVPPAVTATAPLPDLRRRLVAVDVLAVTVATVLAWALVGGTGTRSIAVATIAAAATLAAIAGQGLHRARVCAIRSVELVNLARAAMLGGIAGSVTSRVLDRPMLAPLVVSTIVGFTMLAALRGAYAGWLRRARTQGRYCRPVVVVVGAGDEAARVVWLLRRHPEVGLRPVAVMGPDHMDTGLDGLPMLGGLADVTATVSRMGVNGVLITSGDLDGSQLNALVRELLAAGVHVQLSSGLWGIDHQRLRPVPLAHEPFVYVEPSELRPAQRWCKRTADVVVSSALLVLSSPILLVAALAVRLQDGGPAIFKQVRVGKDGRPFTLLKLRTMVPDAEQQLVDVTSVNQRAGGPLFKASHDPRRTKVGRILEQTSLDELPQLWNVLRGEMSLVGPRPALPHEVAEFDDELLGRHRVQPGITGLWQVEARDKPDFEIYRRLDLFYVDNWSMGLDLAIVFGTACSVLGRILPSRLRGRTPAPA
ncbi:MAG: sugar transferase [Acidimicrobiia bacterium]